MYEQDAAVQMYYVILFMLYYIAMIGIVIYLCYDMHMSVKLTTTLAADTICSNGTAIFNVRKALI